MDPLIWVAIIGAVVTILTALLTSARFILTTILDAYKAQALATVAAKDTEIHSLERLLADEKAGRKDDREIAARLLNAEKAARTEERGYFLEMKTSHEKEFERLHGVVNNLQSTLTALGG